MKYVLMPGWVMSATDGDRHFVGFAALCRAYRLNPYECYDGSRPDAVGRSKGLIELGPRHRDDYEQHLKSVLAARPMVVRLYDHDGTELFAGALDPTDPTQYLALSRADGAPTRLSLNVTDLTALAKEG